MYVKMFSVEWMRLSRCMLLWLTGAACAVYTAMSLGNFYTLNRPGLLNGELKMPGLSFDLANSLDQMLVAMPLLVIVAGSAMGNDYSQHTKQLWLTRVPRSWGILAKLTALAAATLLLQLTTLAVGAAVGLYYKGFVYRVPEIININWLALAAAPLYMTLVNLPYLALALLLVVVVRSAFLGTILALGYAQILEFLLAGLFFQTAWVKWLCTNLHFSVTFLLNWIGNRSVTIPARIMPPEAALITSAAYTAVLVALAVAIYRRQDLGG